MAKKPLEAYPWSLEEIFKYMYVVPVYQRPYSWETKQIDDLIDDLFAAYDNRSDDAADGLFTGTIFLHSTDEKVEGTIEKYEIIDGQQRIASFSLLLSYLYYFCHTYDIKDNDSTFTLLKNSLWKTIKRENKITCRVIEMSSLERQIFLDLFDTNFRKPITLFDYISKYSGTAGINGAEQRVINNFKAIDSKITERFKNKEASELLDFIDFLFTSTQFIVIEVTTDTRKVFDMFESINSKGKKLEDIDLIKTYIFSKLDENDYDEYLKKWGELIVKTDDKLYDYFYNYVKAYVTFYKNNINIINFKALAKGALRTKFSLDNNADESVLFKLLIDDMLDKVQYYDMLDECEKAYKLVSNKKFRYYFEVFTIARYKHPRALFLRTLSDFGADKISKDTVCNIVSSVVKFMIKYSSISSMDSRDSSEIFQDIMELTYGKDLSYDNIAAIFENELIKLSLTEEKIVNDLKRLDVYSKNKILSKVMLSLYEATSWSADKGKYETSFDSAYALLYSFEKSYSLDHLLPQTPSKDNSDYYYYPEVVDGEEVLKLKEGHDFSLPEAADGFNYETFKSIVLHTLGNLRIIYQDDNSRRKTDLVQLREYGKFTTYSDIMQRNKDIVSVLLTTELL